MGLFPTLAGEVRADSICNYVGEDTHVTVEACWDEQSRDVFLYATNGVALTLWVHVDYWLALYEPEGMERKAGFVFSVPPMGHTVHTFSTAGDDVHGFNMMCRFKVSGVN